MTESNNLVIETNEGKFTRAFDGRKLIIGESGCFDIPTRSSHSGWTYESKYSTDLDVSCNQLTVICNGAATDFNYGNDVVDIYRWVTNSSNLSGMSDEEIIANIKTHGNNFGSSEKLDYIAGVWDLSPSTNYTLCAIGVDSNGKTGRLYKKSFTTPSDKYQPEVTFTLKEFTSSKLSIYATMNTYAKKYRLSAYYTQQRSYFVAWWMEYDAANGDPDADLLDWTGIEWPMSNDESELYVYGWAANANDRMSGVVNDAYFSRNTRSNYVQELESTYEENISIEELMKGIRIIEMH